MVSEELIKEINEKCSNYDSGIYFQPNGVPHSIKEHVVYLRYENVIKLYKESEYNKCITNDFEKNCVSTNISNYIKKIIKGDYDFFHKKHGVFYYTNRMVYISDSGESYKQECGEIPDEIKLLGLLKIFIDYAVINSKTIIIIKNPENYLHPAMVVELAKTIVLISKEIGCKFLMTSNNCDFVISTKYIGLKENVKTDFYLCDAEKTNYKGNDIEDIFGSFNKSFDLISEYGAAD